MHMLPYILHFKNKWGGKMVKSGLLAWELTDRPSVHH